MTWSDEQTFLSWLIVSVLLHLAVVFFFRSPVQDLLSPLAPIEVELKEPWQAPERLRPIVEIPPAGREEKPEKSEFLSDRNQRVEKEMQRPDPGRKPRGDAVAQVPQPAAPVERGEGSPSRRETLLKQGSRDPSLLFPGSGADFLPGVRIGDQTYINAEAFEHTSYYLEIKRKIELTWNPRSILQELYSRGEFPQRRMLATYLGVTLSEEGKLLDLLLLRSSGIGRLDAEAKRAFQASQPFTRAPKELLSPDGKLRFEFGFLIYDR